MICNNVYALNPDPCALHRLLAWPRRLQVSPIDVFILRADNMLHPLAVAKLGALFEEPAVATRLNVRFSPQL